MLRRRSIGPSGSLNFPAIYLLDLRVKRNRVRRLGMVEK